MKKSAKKKTKRKSIQVHLSSRMNLYNNPFSRDRLEKTLEILELKPGKSVLDVGCGRGEILIHLMEKYHVSGLGIDKLQHEIDEAEVEARKRLNPVVYEFVNKDVGDIDLKNNSFDVALCIGSTHAMGGYRLALKELRKKVKRGGQIVVGDLFWKSEPPAEYIEIFGEEFDPKNCHAGKVEMGIKERMSPLFSTMSSPEEWDYFEGLFTRSMELEALKNPDDKKIQERLEFGRRWRDLYLKYGRDCLGFGLYIFLKP